VVLIAQDCRIIPLLRAIIRWMPKGEASDVILNGGAEAMSKLQDDVSALSILCMIDKFTELIDIIIY
jgi:hypothetical protein